MDKYEYVFRKFRVRSDPEHQSKDLHKALNKAGAEGLLQVEKMGCCEGNFEGYEIWGCRMARKIE